MAQDEMDTLARDLITRNRASAGAIMLRLLKGNDIASVRYAMGRGAFTKRVGKGKRHNRFEERLTSKVLDSLKQSGEAIRLYPDDCDCLIESMPIRAQIVASCLFEGMTPVETADKTGIPHRTVHNDILTIREILSEYLA